MLGHWSLLFLTLFLPPGVRGVGPNANWTAGGDLLAPCPKVPGLCKWSDDGKPAVIIRMAGDWNSYHYREFHDGFGAVRLRGHQHPGLVLIVDNGETLLSREQRMLLPLEALVGEREDGIVVCTSVACDTLLSKKKGLALPGVSPVIFPPECLYPRFISKKRSVCMRFERNGCRLLEIDTGSGRTLRSYILKRQVVSDVGILGDSVVVASPRNSITLVDHYERATNLPVPGDILWLRRVRDRQTLGLTLWSGKGTVARYSVWVLNPGGELAQVWSSKDAWPFEAHAGPGDTIELSTIRGHVARRERVSVPAQ